MEQSLAIVRGENSGQSSPKNLLPSEPSLPSVASDETNKSSDETNRSSDEKEPDLDPMDQAFVEKATRLVLDNLSDTGFTIDRLCQEMAMSRTLFYGKLTTLTGQGPQDFTRLIRLEQAAL